MKTDVFVAETFAKKKRENRSEIWTDFKQIRNDTGELLADKAACEKCVAVINCTEKTGNSNLPAHNKRLGN